MNIPSIQDFLLQVLSFSSYVVAFAFDSYCLHLLLRQISFLMLVYIDDNERWIEMVNTIQTHLSKGPKTVLKHLHY